MKLILDKYRKLKPRIEYLTDEAIIAQAWKKRTDICEPTTGTLIRSR